jgi:hypothetical protein
LEFEQKGEDCAKYGENLFSELAKAVKINPLPDGELKDNNNLTLTISQLVTDQFKNTKLNDLQLTPERLINRRSLTDIVQEHHAAL